MQLLLISTDCPNNGGYLEHVKEDLQQFLDDLPGKHVLFIPWAVDKSRWNDCTRQAKLFFHSLEHDFRSIADSDPKQALADGQLKAVFIRGGNTFRLIKALQNANVVELIQQRIKQGVGYIGESAGSNVACPTIQTTNDMPIVVPRNFEALNLVNFQINPHFVPGKLRGGHDGETREQRIAEYHELNARTVIGLPESSWININNSSIKLKGRNAAIIFNKDRAPRTWLVGTELQL